MEPIKRLDELTHKELINIKVNSPEYNRIIDLECAYAGVSLLPEHPGPEPAKSTIAPDCTLYKVGSWGFNSINAAEDVINYMISKGIYKEETKSNISVMLPMDEDSYCYLSIKKTPIYSETAYEQMKCTLEEVAVIQAEWKQKNSEYQSAVKERKEIVDAFAAKTNYAAEIANGIDKIRFNLQRYLTLAQGSYPIAIGFLKEADKHGEIRIDDGAVYYTCSKGMYHLVTTREQYQKECVGDLLGVQIPD